MSKGRRGAGKGTRKRQDHARRKENEDLRRRGFVFSESEQLWMWPAPKGGYLTREEAVQAASLASPALCRHDISVHSACEACGRAARAGTAGCDTGGR